MEFIENKRTTLSVFSLTMMNVIAVDSLRNLAVSAEYGAALISFYIIAATPAYFIFRSNFFVSSCQHFKENML